LSWPRSRWPGTSRTPRSVWSVRSSRSIAESGSGCVSSTASI
jgi:hypothetical protein